MRRVNGIFLAAVLVCLAAFADGLFKPALALTRDEYKAMAAKSSLFREEAAKLDKALKTALAAFADSRQDAIRASQSRWLKKEVDREAGQYMASGIGREDAYARACARRTSLLNILLDNARLAGELPPPSDLDADAPVGKWARNCGQIKGDLPIKDALHVLLLANEKGEKQRYYYFQDNNAKEDMCGAPGDMICFNILEEMPVSPKLRQAGVRGYQMTIIDRCAPAYQTPDGRLLARKPKEPAPSPAMAMTGGAALTMAAAPALASMRDASLAKIAAATGKKGKKSKKKKAAEPELAAAAMKPLPPVASLRPERNSIPGGADLASPGKPGVKADASKAVKAAVSGKKGKKSKKKKASQPGQLAAAAKKPLSPVGSLEREELAIPSAADLAGEGEAGIKGKPPATKKKRSAKKRKDSLNSGKETQKPSAGAGSLGQASPKNNPPAKKEKAA